MVIMGFNAFNYWKRGKKAVPMLKKAPKNSPYPLVWHQIQKGCYDLSPYWDLIKLEHTLFEKEIHDFKKNNSRASQESIDAFITKRRPVYNKRIRKLQEAHHEYESKRLTTLKSQLIADFGIDVWDKTLETCVGDSVLDFYNTYQQIVAEM